MVECTPGYKAGQCCFRGHVLLGLEGELQSDLKDGRKIPMNAGMSYQVATDAGTHRSSLDTGAKLFIVDYLQ